MPCRTGRWCWLLVLLLPLQLLAAAPIVVRYPPPESNPDQRSRYPLKLLELVLKRAERNYRVEVYPYRMVQGRALLCLENNEGIDVLSTMTSTEREARLQPIRIPIDKGLIGWRLFLINKARAERFKGIASLDQLKPLGAGQGSDWPDTRILRANGLTVHGSSSYVSLFNMLESGRIDYFPRSITEIWSEAARHQDQLGVEPGIVLRYPTAIYFFVRKNDKQLAADLTSGLEKMIADGSFEKLFQEHYGETIRRAGLQDRRIIDLDNPLMPAHMPVHRKPLWFRE